MRKNYKYLIILAFILNFTNIYSQSNNYIYTWYNESIYIDNQLLESTANALSQYLGPLAPIVENLPILISFFALFFMSRKFINIFNSQAPESEKLIASLVMSIPLTFFFWPFFIPILIIAFIIKVFRIGKSKLESFKETLGKINSGLESIFSKAVSYIKDFDNDANKVLKDINKLDKIIKYSHIRNLLDSIKKDVENLNNILSQLLKETENEELTLDKLKDYSSKFNIIYNDAINNTKQLYKIINPILTNPSLLGKFENIIFKTNKITQKYLAKLGNILNDLITRLNNIYKDGQKTFEYLNKLLISAESASSKYESNINNILKGILNNNSALLLLGNNNKALIKEVHELDNIAVATYKDWRISPLKKMKILSEINESTKDLSKSLRKLSKFKGNLKKLSNLINRSFNKTINSIRSALKISRKR